MGKVDKLGEKLQGKPTHQQSVLRIRAWATHGSTWKKTRTRISRQMEKLALVQNGIIENYRELKKELEKSGVKFESEPDTEVFGTFYRGNYEGDLVKAVKNLCLKSEGMGF